MLEEAITNLVAQSEPTNRGIELIQFNRKSRTAFISGARGAGKTSVLLTLMRAVIDKSFKIDYRGVRGRFQPAIDRARKHLVWLEPIDLDPLPSPFSLIPAVLDRTFDAILRIRGQFHPKWAHTQAELIDHQMVVEFQSIYRDATLAWDSNIADRKSELDPDYYAHEVQRTSQARLKLSHRIDRFLEDVGNKLLREYGIENPIFVVTIDDFDMHPTASLQILKLLRMLSSPRLFFVLLGDIHLLEAMSDIGKSSELGSIVGVHTDIEKLGIRPEQLARLGGAISRNALRKLLPTEQRAIIVPPTIAEGLLYGPVGIIEEKNAEGSSLETPTLADFCNAIPFPINPSLLAECWTVWGRPVVSLLDYLFHPGFQVYQNKNENSYELADEDNSGKSRQQFKLEKFKDLDGIQLTGELKRKRELNADRLAGRFISLNSGGTCLTLKPRPFLKSGNAETATKNLTICRNHKTEFKFAIAIRRFNEVMEGRFSWANHLFSTSPRRLADLWYSMRRQVTRLHRLLADWDDWKTSQEAGRPQPVTTDSNKF